MIRTFRIVLPLAAALTLGACSSLHHEGPTHQLSQAETDRKALSLALAEADTASANGFRNAQDQIAYNRATEKAVKLWMALSDDKTRGARLDVPTASGVYQLKASWPSTLLFDELIPASTIKTKVLKTRFTREGVGAPFLAHWKYSPERKLKEPFMIEFGYTVSVTATIEFHAVGKGARAATVVLHDPRNVTKVQLAGKPHALAADFSCMGEYVLSVKEAGMSGLRALLNSGKYMDKLGIIAFERPAKDRIPVIMVHGLLSRPATWQNVYNELNADPVLQSKYQIFFFRYPTGVPVIFSAAKFREQLKVLHASLEHEGNNRFGQHMVLIGHSMGGLVSKMQTQKSGDRVWINIFGEHPEKLGVPKEDIAALRTYMEFSPNPYVDRVIFVATPHRGSELAAGTLGSIGRRLVSLPGKVLGNTFDILQGNAPQSPILRDMLKAGVPTSIDNLSPRSRYVTAFNSLPLRPGIHVHSIIGNKDPKPLNDPECSDGFVPYVSSHLDGVESELVVHSGHSAHENPEAVAEIKRILKLHAASLK